MDFAYGPDLRRRIIDRLDQFSHQSLDREGLRHAAVGVVIIGGGQGGEGRVLLTKRPEHLNRHGGQYALPGGRLDDEAGTGPKGRVHTHRGFGTTLPSGVQIPLVEVA